MVKLDIFSDPICPWCYIGKLRLDRALEARPNHPFTVEWHPFQLNPDMPAGGMVRAEYLERKFGGKEAAAKVYAQIDQHARDTGLEIDWSAISRTPNTLDAHRLIHWAGIEGRQTAAVSRLFKAYFLEGRDIGEHEVLADIADGIGLDASVILRLLGSEADREETMARDTQAREIGIDSVPTFIVAGKHAMPGAQETALWEKVIDEVSAQLSEQEG
ncbi:Predicted dithiol-disulfide isomerase, DsbA family [Poseidonocella pacifica]|uniref:Predicted dithiol-disulfide isomerase, DsbA family n=1 Tax=Poseidonocella pacifica TaxID=871651 RepID=A0A1I0VLP5_9RHOB|nr:DsbA family oxidoreductase [Poseidonocella pacifica]SFA77138.1 Predicted dithiol-disulfide isomerase, DsbA family [Poseidonocella pacifica]